MLQEVYIIDDNVELINVLKELFKEEEEFVFKSVRTEDIDEALKSIPALIIVHEDGIEKDIIELGKQIRENEDNTITPIIVVSSNTAKEHRVDILKTAVEYFIKKPIDKDYLYYTVKNITRLMHTNRRVSPLTGLPGNVQIQSELKKRLLKRENFAVLYFDLDNFKAYNDTYGFLCGDEIIKQTARTIVSNVNTDEKMHNFVGHIGGDDFVAVVSDKNYEKICQNIIIEFDEKIKQYYTKEDLERGYLEVPNRKGIIEAMPIVSISIGVVEVDRNRFKNVLDIGEVGAEVKHLAKTIPGSTYAIDRRKT